MTKGLQTSQNLSNYAFIDSHGTTYTITRVIYELGTFSVEMTPDNVAIKNIVIATAKTSFPGGLDPKQLQQRIKQT